MVLLLKLNVGGGMGETVVLGAKKCKCQLFREVLFTS